MYQISDKIAHEIIQQIGNVEEEAAEVPTWCDPTNEMGAWPNYASIRAICGEWGFTDFGPYGGLPAIEVAEEGDEAVEGDIAEEMEEAIEEIHSCRRTPHEAPTSLSQIQKQKELNLF